MKDKKITTGLGNTMMYSNKRFHGKHTTPLIYLHGGPGSPNPYAVDIIDYNGPIFTYDQFGSGSSDMKAHYAPDLFVEQLHELIEKEFSCDKIILMGASWGGTLACLYAEKYGTDRLKGIILASPLMDEGDNSRQNKSTIDLLPESLRAAIKKGDDSGFFGETYALAKRAFFKEEYGRHDTEESCDWSFRLTSEVYRQMWGPDESACTGTIRGLSVVDGLAGIDVPILYISGDRDIHSVDDVRRYSSLMKDVELHVLDDTGHYVNSHPDYDDIIRSFIERIDPYAPEIGEDDFYLQDDYDMIVYDSLHDTPANLELQAHRMTDEECLVAADRYEKGDGVPQSYLSASIFIDVMLDRNQKKFGLGSIDRKIDRIDYDVSYKGRRLILSSRGLESTCCDKLRKVINGHGWSNGVGHLSRNDKQFDDPDRMFQDCPFCGCKLETINPQNVPEIKSDEEYDCIMSDYLEHPHSLEDSVVIYNSLCNYASSRSKKFTEYGMRKNDYFKKLQELELEHVRNVTGVLSRSSTGFESVCCQSFADYFKGISSWHHDRYYASVKFGDGKRISNFKRCPYCDARMKRVPRTY